MTSTSTATVSPAMTPTASRSGAEVDAWLHQAFMAARAPAPCRLPAPHVVTEIEPRRAHATPPAVRTSFVLMLALSASMLLLGA
jgi:hypothetical protein